MARQGNNPSKAPRKSPRSKPRLEKEYQPVRKASHILDDYPRSVVSLRPSLHDIRYIQGLLANDANFAASSQCDIFESTSTGSQWKRDLDDESLRTQLGPDSRDGTTEPSQSLEAASQHATRPMFRAM